MASPMPPPVAGMASMPELEKITEKGPNEEMKHERDISRASTSDKDETVESQRNSTEADRAEVAAPPDANSDTRVSTGTVQSQTAEIRTEVALALSFTRELAFEWLCHIIALAVTLYLVSLPFTDYYWVDEHEWNYTWYFAHLSQNDVLKALQFAAKAHETFIIMSLLAIVLHLVRRRLTAQEGLSVGHLVSGYQIENLSVLFRKRLWSPTFVKRLQDPGAVVVTIVLFVSVLLAKLVGPASAILVLPSLRWWYVANPFAGQPWISYNCTEDEMYPMDLSTKSIIDRWVDYGCSQSNSSFWCPGIGWEELNEWSGSNALRATPENLTMAESNGRYQRILASTSSYTWLTTETAATLHNGVTELYTQVWDDMQYGYANLSQAIERPRLEPSRTINGVVTQVQCTSIPRSQLSKNQSWVVSNFGPNWTIPVSKWDYTGSWPTSTVNLTWIEMNEASQKSIGVLVTLPQAFQNRSGVDIHNDTTLRQESVICPCAVVTRWALVNMAWDANTTDIVPSNLTKAILPDLGYVWDDNELAQDYGASGPIRIGVEWAEMLNFDGRIVEAGNGQTVNVSSIEALFWRHMSPWSRAGDDIPIWTRFEYGSPSHVQADNETWDGDSVERLAARILSLAVSD
ncbi:hypothetical protein PG988_004534 [Apiospora saccharicola]